MSNFNSRFTLRTHANPGVQANIEIDAGLREYMLRIYNYMASALTLTGIIAYFSANTPAIINGPKRLIKMNDFFLTLVRYSLLIISPILFVPILKPIHFEDVRLSL